MACLPPPTHSPCIYQVVTNQPAGANCRRGRLVYVDKEYRQDYVCSPPCKFACQDFAVRPRLSPLPAPPRAQAQPFAAAARGSLHLLNTHLTTHVKPSA